MPTLPRCTAALGLGAGLLALGAASGAGAETAAPPALVQNLDALNATEFVARDRASEELNDALTRLRSGDQAEAWPEIERGLVRAACSESMSVEARVRVLACLKRQFFESARAAIGISFGQNPQDPREVRIQQVHRGFPAGDAGILQTGDVIVSIDGVQISGNTDFMNTTRTMICSRDPGDIVKIAIARRSDPAAEPVPLTVDVPLGSFDQLIRPDLPRADQIGYEALEAAWRVRLHRLGWVPDAELAVLPASLPAEEWNRFTREPRARRAPRIELAEAGPGADEFAINQLTNGAERLAAAQRGAGPDQMENLRLQLGVQRNAMRRNPPVQPDGDDGDRALLFMLQNQIAERLQLATRYAQELERANISKADRFRLQAQHDREMQAIAQLQMQIRDITSQIEAQRIMRERQRPRQQP